MNEEPITLEMFKDDEEFSTMYLEQQGINDDETKIIIAEGLKTNTTLKKLVLYENYITDEGAIAMASALEINTTLTYLSLSCNEIGTIGAVAIANALKKNAKTALTDLGLPNNNIGPDGAKAFANLLKTNTTLANLSLAFNPMGTQGLISIFDALKTNTTLSMLYLGSPPGEADEVGRTEGMAVADLLKTNTSLTRLDFWDDTAEDDVITAIKDALKMNGMRTKVIYISFLDRRFDERLEEYIERNQRAHERVKKAMAQIDKNRPDRELYAASLWASRGDPMWWLPEEGGSFEEPDTAQESETKRLRLGKCIQCTVQDAAWKERDTPSRMFCGSYCQILYHTNKMNFMYGAFLQE